MKYVKTLFKWLAYGLIIVIFLFPFFWLMSSSLKTLGETLQFPPTLLPSNPQWENFKLAVESMPFWTYLKNSIIVSLSVVVTQGITVTLAAYGFARYRFKGRDLSFGIVMASMMIPTQLTFLPIFVMFSKLDMINSLATLILPFATSAFGIFMLRQTFMSIPNEIIEAAKLDNASEMTIVRKIMIPMARPTIVTLMLVSFIGAWNEYFWPLVLTTSESARTLPVGVASMINQESGTNFHILMAGNVLLIIPILLVYIVAHRNIVKAFTYQTDK